MKHLYHELDVFVDGRRVYSYREAGRIPTVEDMMAAIRSAIAPEHAATK